MQQRHTGAKALDDFPTPPWATRALCEELKRRGLFLHLLQAWDPACNRGHMVRPLSEYFDRVHASDIADYGFREQSAVQDFLLLGADVPEVDIIVTNPPFRLAVPFILRALDLAPMVAVLVRNAFDEGAARYDSLFADSPEWLALPFTERVVMWEGVLLDPDVSVWRESNKEGASGKLEKPTTATAYQWLVFKRDWHGDTLKKRIAPCRKDLTRVGDYPALPDHLQAPAGTLV